MIDQLQYYIGMHIVLLSLSFFFADPSKTDRFKERSHFFQQKFKNPYSHIHKKCVINEVSDMKLSFLLFCFVF
jgi:hypothetical protein